MSQEKKIREKKKPTLLHAVIPLLGPLVCLSGGYACRVRSVQVCLLRAVDLGKCADHAVGDGDGQDRVVREKVAGGYQAVRPFFDVAKFIPGAGDITDVRAQLIQYHIKPSCEESRFKARPDGPILC